MNRRVSLRKGERMAKCSSLIVASIGIMKGVVGFLSGSVALLAQAIDSLSDVFSSFAVFLGLRLSQKAPTEKFPYGYYRAETFASLIVSIVILVSGVLILRESIVRFLKSEAIDYPVFAVAVAGLSIPILYVLARYHKTVGEEINSQALVGQSKNFVIDAFSSVLVFVGIITWYSGVPRVEPIIGGFISILILKTGVELGKDSVLSLMDHAVTPEHITKIKQIAVETPEVIGAHDVKIRKAGPFCFGEMHLEVKPGLSVEKAHAISDKIEEKVKQECETLERLTIHIEPRERTRYRIAIPVGRDEGLGSPMNSHFGDAPYFILIDVEGDQIKQWEVTSNPGAKLTRKKGITSANFLVDKQVDTLLIGKLGGGPFHLLKDNLVEVYHLSEPQDVKKILNKFLQDKLEKMTAPN